MSFRFKSTLKLENVPFKLPPNWTWYKWGDLITDYQQGLIRSNRELTESGIPYLKMNNLDNDGSYTLNKLEYTNATDDEIDKYKLSKGDFLLNVRNSKELVGKTCVIGSHNFDLVYNHMLVRIKHHNGISGAYINALLKIPVMRKFIDRCKSGTTTVIALYQRDLYEIPIPLPDKSTHDSLVSFIESISLKIELNNRINAELESMAKMLYDYWFVQFDFLDKNAKPYKTSGGKMIWNEKLKRKIPEGWDVDIMDTVLSELTKGITTEYVVKSNLINLNQKVNKGFSLERQYFKYLDESIIIPQQKYAREKDILINSLGQGTIGRVHFFCEKAKNIVVDQHLFILRTNEKKVTAVYFYLLLTSKAYQVQVDRQITGSTGMQMLNASNLRDIDIVIPKLEVMQQFEKSVYPFFQKVVVNELENQKLTELRDWLLPMLMNGQVKIR